MRIALVIERFDPAGGGMEAVAWQVAHGLAEAGDEVHVVCREAVASTAVHVKLVSVPSRWQPLRVTAFSRRAARAAPRGDFDVVHAFSRTLEQDVYRAGGGSHADYLERAHGPWGRRLRRLSPRHALLLGMERRIFDDPSQTIQCGSQLVRDEISARFDVAPSRLRVLYNGVDLRRFHPAGLPETRERADGPVWLFIGSGWHRKGLDIALAALAATRERAPLLWVAGRDAPSAWQRMAGRLGVAERVSFLGPRADVDHLYRQADGLILPTRYDAFANVCLEAAASGLPVITSGANGSSEILEDAGIIVEDPEDRAGFAEALDRLSDAGTREAMGARGRERAHAFTWPEHVARLRELYREVRR
jgi:UDP-glucose:(heptosyl)LPS alpha-1,3-glucosyltransferase